MLIFLQYTNILYDESKKNKLMLYVLIISINLARLPRANLNLNYFEMVGVMEKGG
jgi:hypothetical protein